MSDHKENSLDMKKIQYEWNMFSQKHHDISEAFWWERKVLRACLDQNSAQLHGLIDFSHRKNGFWFSLPENAQKSLKNIVSDEQPAEYTPEKFNDIFKTMFDRMIIDDSVYDLGNFVVDFKKHDALKNTKLDGVSLPVYLVEHFPKEEEIKNKTPDELRIFRFNAYNAIFQMDEIFDLKSINHDGKSLLDMSLDADPCIMKALLEKEDKDVVLQDQYFQNRLSEHPAHADYYRQFQNPEFRQQAINDYLEYCKGLKPLLLDEEEENVAVSEEVLNAIPNEETADFGAIETSNDEIAMTIRPLSNEEEVNQVNNDLTPWEYVQEFCRYPSLSPYLSYPEIVMDEEESREGKQMIQLESDVVILEKEGTENDVPSIQVCPPSFSNLVGKDYMSIAESIHQRGWKTVELEGDDEKMEAFYKALCAVSGGKIQLLRRNENGELVPYPTDKQLIEEGMAIAQSPEYQQYRANVLAVKRSLQGNQQTDNVQDFESEQLQAPVSSLKEDPKTDSPQLVGQVKQIPDEKKALNESMLGAVVPQPLSDEEMIPVPSKEEKAYQAQIRAEQMQKNQQEAESLKNQAELTAVEKKKEFDEAQKKVKYYQEVSDSNELLKQTTAQNLEKNIRKVQKTEENVKTLTEKLADKKQERKILDADYVMKDIDLSEVTDKKDELLKQKQDKEAEKQSVEQKIQHLTSEIESLNEELAKKGEEVFDFNLDASSMSSGIQSAQQAYQKAEERKISAQQKMEEAKADGKDTGYLKKQKNEAEKAFNDSQNAFKNAYYGEKEAALSSKELELKKAEVEKQGLSDDLDQIDTDIFETKQKESVLNKDYERVSQQRQKAEEDEQKIQSVMDANTQVLEETKKRVESLQEEQQKLDKQSDISQSELLKAQYEQAKAQEASAVADGNFAQLATMAHNLDRATQQAVNEAESAQIEAEAEKENILYYKTPTQEEEKPSPLNMKLKQRAMPPTFNPSLLKPKEENKQIVTIAKIRSEQDEK